MSMELATATQELENRIFISLMPAMLRSLNFHMINFRPYKVQRMLSFLRLCSRKWYLTGKYPLNMHWTGTRSEEEC